MSETAEKKKRDLPLWVGILLVAIGLAGAGWFVWSQVSGFWSGPSGVFTIEGVDPSARPQPRRQGPPPRPQVTVREMSKTEWRARTAAFNMDVKKGTDGKLSLVVSASTTRVLPADWQWVMVAKPRLSDAVAGQIGLSAEQVRQFKALPTNIRHQLSITDAQNQQLVAAFEKYLAAADPQKPAAEQELAAAMNACGQAALPALTQQLQSQYDRYTKTLKPDQWAKLRQLTTAPPASAPAK